MARLNVRTTVRTHEGGVACQVSALEELKRAVMSCLLWEDTFYESGVDIATRIKTLVAQCRPEDVSQVAIDAAENQNLRHVPLLVARELARRPGIGNLVADTIARVVRRPDSLTEFMAIYWADGRQPVSNGVRNGLARAFTKFNAYSLAKYNRDTPIKLRDVMFLVHPKPVNDEQAKAFEQLANNTLPTPDTWEVGLSTGGNKKEVFTRLLNEDKLGYLALLRNLRNMQQAGVDATLVENAIRARKGGAERVLPFRYTAAARIVPQFEPALDDALLAAIDELPKFDGRTMILVDVSGSMNSKLSMKSDLSRFDAAATLASIFPGEARVFAFSNGLKAEVPRRMGMAGVDALRAVFGGGTRLASAIDQAREIGGHDRLVIITDEQSHDGIAVPGCDKAYILNVASYQNGVGYGQFTHINGFSENVLTYMRELEAANV